MIRSGSMGGLEYDLSPADGATDGGAVAVLLHGRGSHKGDLQALGPLLPDDWTLLTPQAPYPGESWGYGPGWAWYRYEGDDRIATETLEPTFDRLDAFLAGLDDVLGFSPGRVVLGGFSQGGTTSLAYSLARPRPLAAVWIFSGFLAASAPTPDAEGAPEATPVFWGHGRADPNVPIRLAQRGRARLEQAGVPLVSRDYPIGHWMVPDELHEAVAMLGAAGEV